MTIFSRRLLIGALTVLLFTTSCNLPVALTPPPAGTIPAAEQAESASRPSGTRNNATPTALIPVTGMDAMVTLQCQFCVHSEPHAVLLMPEAASFNVSEPVIGVTCLTAQVINGRRMLLCRGAQQTTFNLNVCMDGSDCVQVPFLLDTCPLDPQDAIPTPRATSTVPAPAPATPVDTRIPRAWPSLVASPTQTAIIALPSTPTAAPALITPQPPASGLQTPDGFIRWYFAAVWNGRNYEDLWNNYLTPNFKAKVGSGIYQDYVDWWNSVKQVDVNSVEVIQNDGSHAWVRVNINFHMQDGRVLNNQEYEYSLLYNATRGTWMFN